VGPRLSPLEFDLAAHYHATFIRMVPMPRREAATLDSGQYHGRPFAGVAVLDGSRDTRWKTRRRRERAASHSHDGGLLLSHEALTSS
jgi:hypothetical protein